MMGLNLHNVVRGAITAIHPDETVTLYQSAGQRNVKGKIVSIYNEPQEVKANFQPLDSDALKHAVLIALIFSLKNIMPAPTEKIGMVAMTMALMVGEPVALSPYVSQMK